MAEIGQTPTEKKPTDNYTVLGPELFTNGDVISYKGENYYRACDERVTTMADGGQSFCVKRVNHPGKIHEDYEGRIRVS
jgi:hypothetical protein